MKSILYELGIKNNDTLNLYVTQFIEFEKNMFKVYITII